MTEKNNRVEIEEIKPCPFCESEAELRQGHTVLDNYVQCKRCGCRTKVFNTKRCAVKAWNKRKPMDRIVEEVNEIGRRVCNNVKCNHECVEDSERICDHGVLMGAVIDAIVKGVQNE